MKKFREWLRDRHGMTGIRSSPSVPVADYVDRTIGFLAEYVEEMLAARMTEPAQEPRSPRETIAADARWVTFDDVKRWVELSFARAGVDFRDLATVEAEGPDRLEFVLWSRSSCFTVIARKPAEPGRRSHFDQGYLGAQVGNRLPDPGESHLRGNDLSDGPLCLDTWQCIVADIAACGLERAPREAPGS